MNTGARFTRLQRSRMPIQRQCRFHEFDWSGTVRIQVLDATGRVLVGRILHDPKVSDEYEPELIRDKRTTLRLNLWSERDMYDLEVKPGDRFGRVRDEYVFLVANGALLYNKSDYERTEKEHIVLRQRIVDISRGNPAFASVA